MSDALEIFYWWVKDYADGWIKFSDRDCALQEAEKTGALLVYAIQPPKAALQYKQVDLQTLKQKIGVLLGDEWGGNILQRNQMAIDFTINYLASQGHLTAQPEWLPIESAPKDGTTIMVWRKNHGGIWWGSFDGHKWLVVYGNNKVHAKDITHWMPLPTPPKQEGE